MNKTPEGAPQVSPKDAIISLLKAQGESQLARFAELCLERVPPEDLEDWDPAALAHALRDFFLFSAERRPGERKLRIFNPESERDHKLAAHTVLETIGEDIPFLVDSLLAFLNGQKLAVAAIWHPVLSVKRDANGKQTDVAAADRGSWTNHESMIRIEFARIASAERRAEIERLVQNVLADVGLAVRDWQAMSSRLMDVMDELKRNPPPGPEFESDEAQAFLRWLAQGDFIFLGARDYVLSDSNGRRTLEMNPSSGLGLLSDPERRVVRRGTDRVSLSPDLEAFIAGPEPLIITKANARSTVHRPAHMDYIGVKRFGAGGVVTGERRFVGLFTSAAYSRHVTEIPYLRGKVSRARARAGFAPGSHDDKAYLNILETFPRDELFQISDNELYETTIGILRLSERPRTKIFVRHDKFDRFVSVLVFVPRDRYDSNLRQKIMSILIEAFDGRPSAYYPVFGDEPLARIHFIIGRNNGGRPTPDIGALESKIAQAVHNWDDDLAAFMRAQFGETEGTERFERTRNIFGAGYREAFSAAEAITDLGMIGTMRGALAIRAYRFPDDKDHALRIKLYHRDTALVLSEVLPVLERFGLRVEKEQTYPLEIENGKTLFIHDFAMADARGLPIDLSAVKHLVEETFFAVWRNSAESDGLNKLVIRAHLTWRQVSVMRAIGRFLRQAAITYSFEYMEDALANNPQIAAATVALFEARFDPRLTLDEAERSERVNRIRADIERALAEVASLDEDRILRRFTNVIEAMLRTNFYQSGALQSDTRPIAFKLDSRTLSELPPPVPMFEIFVYAPDFEAVHLRFGKVARGGIRWSDRREDFRTEILGLVKAQRVKNAVIVPVGAKGGFYPKRLGPTATREQRDAEGVRCYKLFIGTMLDLTDNLVERKIVPPKDTVRYDTDDPYLVVAADKGTASFSDIANAIALERKFWLGDAFASGGSDGYDHKKMGITARGAWEAVKRHFRELNVDIQITPFTVIGVGDMSGDVFGNGMLQSKAIKLIAAFDHRDIFIDPDPDAIKSFAERERLFALPRSSWADYDKSLIGKGGGVFSRSLKSITLTAEMKAITGLSAERVTPAELIRALLAAHADLLFFGGIGTYVKASGESHLDVGDRANDTVRVDGASLRARVVGEGANLGATQRGRIEYARAGGRINSDAIDNSAGVDTSDHEVNLKILLDAQPSLDKTSRNSLLDDVETDIARLVLEDNYRQTLAISICEATAKEDLPAHAQFMNALEQSGELDRAVERLPSHKEIEELGHTGIGLTRPELAVLIAYAKLTLYEKLIATGLPDEPQFASYLLSYFPALIRAKFESAIPAHPLKREITATVLANSIVNLAGPLFAHSILQDEGRSAEEAVRAFVTTCSVFDLDLLYDGVNALDDKIDAARQIQLHLGIKNTLHIGARTFLRAQTQSLSAEAPTTTTHAVVDTMAAAASDLLSPFVREKVEAERLRLVDAGVPENLSRKLALLEPLIAAISIASIARDTEKATEMVAAVFFGIKEALALDRLAAMAEDMPLANDWDRRARIRLTDDLERYERCLTADLLRRTDKASGRDLVEAWTKDQAVAVERFRRLINDAATGGLTVAKLSVAVGELRTLANC